MTAPVLLLGGGLTPLGVTRSLGRRGIPVTVCVAAQDDIVFHTRHATPYSLPKGPDDSDVVARLTGLARALPQKPVLLVTGDDFLQFASRNRRQLTEHMHLCLPPADAIETVVNKDLFQQYAREHSLATPRGFAPGSVKELDGAIGWLRFPVIVKPVRSTDWHAPAFLEAYGHIKMLRVADATELRALCSRLASFDSPLLVQEYVRGGDEQHYSYVSYRRRDGAEVSALCVRKLRLHPINGGAVALARIEADEEMRVKAQQALDALGYTGVSSVCFKRDTVTGEASIYEINGRLPMVHSIFAMVGIDLPYLMYQDALGIDPVCQPPTRIDGKWVALGQDIWSFREYHRSGELSLRQWLASYRGVRMVAEYARDDPGPLLYLLRSMLRAGLSGLARRYRP